MADVEIFTPTGVLAGLTPRVPLTNDGSDLTRGLGLSDARWYPLDGTPPCHRGDIAVPTDDILLIVTDEPEMKVHMAWYSIALEVGPYKVAGRLATHPGFDPAKAIARPTSTFIALSDAVIELGGRTAGSAERRFLHVNRYAVDSVTSTLMLGYFFPGARLVGQGAASVA